MGKHTKSLSVAAMIGAAICILWGLKIPALLCCGAGLILLAVDFFQQGRLLKKAETSCLEWRKKAEDTQNCMDQEIRMAQQRAKDEIIQFHSEVSHGLRLPISVVQGYADLLQGDLITEEEVRREYLQKICVRTSYMSNLLGELLDAGRRKAELPFLSLCPLNVVLLARSIIGDLEDIAGQKGIKLDVNATEQSIMVLGDETQLTKAFFSILESSLRYVEKDGTISVTVSRAQEDKAALVFRDDGQRTDDQDPFLEGVRLKGSTSGLYLTKLAIQAHGGEVIAKSGGGRGFSILILLPVIKAE